MTSRFLSWLPRSHASGIQAAGSSASETKPSDRAGQEGENGTSDGFRETTEQIVIAFILAFVFRTFAAEPFVIPTGSMAPTLFGRHKEYTCAGCGFFNVIGASDELIDESGYLIAGGRIRQALCQNCGHVNDVQSELAHTGDRIIVSKYPYEMGSPQRWDVFVFKFPETPTINYIKRLVGLPGETIRIRDGDLYRWNSETRQEEILRKEPHAQRLLQIPVYDDRHPPRRLLEAGWPERWAAVERTGVGGLDGWTDTDLGFTHDAQTREFHLHEPRADHQWIRYRHYQSRLQDWRDLDRGDPLSKQARLIGDVCGYNAFFPSLDNKVSLENLDAGPYWVRDLTVSFTIDVHTLADDAELLIELVEGVHRYRCRIDLASGQARLSTVNHQNDPRDEQLLAKGSTRFQGSGTHHVSFSNVDNRLCLWVDNRLIDFGEGANYSEFGALANNLPTAADLTPVGIAVRGAGVTISDLLLERDIYYRVERSEFDQLGRRVPRDNRAVENDLVAAMMRPHDWGRVYAAHHEIVGEMEITVGPRHYLALGDNSPRSNDGRLWFHEFRTVPRELLVGKAFWIYWPHGIPFLNDGRGYTLSNHYEMTKDGPELVEDYPRYTFPFYPNFWRMRLIH